MSRIEENVAQDIVTTIEKSFQDSDQTIPYRLVGSYEYAKSLETFSKLLNLSTAEEILVYDRVLNDRPEFTYFNGVNSAFASKPDLKQANPFQRQKFYDSFQRKGLAWMMGLGRVELGATMSMYGQADLPFHVISTSNFDLEAYVHVLADDAIAHMKSLAQEPGFDTVTKRGRKVDTWTLAYLRRLKLIRDMLGTLKSIGNAEVRARIAPYDTELSKYERRLMTEVILQTQPRFAVQTTNRSNTRYSSTTLKVSNRAISDCQDRVREYNSGSDDDESPGPSFGPQRIVAASR